MWYEMRTHDYGVVLEYLIGQIGKDNSWVHGLLANKKHMGQAKIFGSIYHHIDKWLLLLSQNNSSYEIVLFS